MAAGLAHGLHGHIAWAVNQILPDKADIEYVRRWGNMMGLSERPASEAYGIVTFTRTSGSGALMADGALVQHSDGRQYVIALPAGETDTTITVGVTAVVAGRAGNLAAGETLTLVTPVADIDDDGLVGAGAIRYGTDDEGKEQYRARVVRKLSNLGSSGAPGDFVSWALEVPGVLKAWERSSAAGEVEVLFVDGEYETGEYDFPGSSRVDQVDDYIETRAPITITVATLSPTAQGVSYSMSITPDTPEVRAAVEAELRALHAREGNPGETLLLSHIREAISSAVGEEDYTLTAPAADVVASSADHIPVFSSVTFS